jgi:hypothetical protein
MQVTILYRSNTEHERSVIEFQREYQYRTGRQIKMLDLETEEGASVAKLYDVTVYPAIIATTDDGQMLQLWQDDPLPLINEVMYYDHKE